MLLGDKLKNARQESGLSQEGAAEAIGVSRQTLSAWENDKTYPDIASLTKLSDLYHISLDTLLKEDDEADSYIEHIDSMIAAVQKRRRLRKYTEIGTYILLVLVQLLIFFLCDDIDDRMSGYITIHLSLMPYMILIISLVIGADSAWGDLRWLLIPCFGIGHLLTSLSVMDLVSQFDPFSFFSFYTPLNGSDFLLGAGISAVGLGLGALVRNTNP